MLIYYFYSIRNKYTKKEGILNEEITTKNWERYIR